ncbi:putative transglutaminase, N-terminal domain protein, partial [Mycobacterium xenopi 4042]
GRQRAGERTELTDLLDGVHRGLRDLSGIITPPNSRCRAMHRCPGQSAADGAVTSPEGHAATGSLTAPNTAIPTWSPAPTARFSHSRDLPASAACPTNCASTRHRRQFAQPRRLRQHQLLFPRHRAAPGADRHQRLGRRSRSAPDELYGSGSAWAPWRTPALRRRTAHWPSSSPSTWIRRRSPTRYVTMPPRALLRGVG